MSHPTEGFAQGLPKKSGYYLFIRKPGCAVGAVMVKVLLPGDKHRELVRFMDSWRRGKDAPAPDVIAKAERNFNEFRLDDPFIIDGWYRPVNTDTLEPDNETSVRAAIELLHAGDVGAALEVLDGLLPDSEPVTLIRDAGGA